MISHSLLVHGFGYLHEINVDGLIQIVVIQPANRWHPEAEAIWLECQLNSQLQSFFTYYQQPLLEGKLIILEFEAKLVANCALDKVDNVVTWRAQLTKVCQIYVENKPMSYPSEAVVYH